MSDIETHGFAVRRAVLDPDRVTLLRRELEPLLAGCGSAGLRGIAEKSRAVQELAHSNRVRELVNEVLGNGARPVRSILFNKHPESNWRVTWHQDLSIAVEERHEVEGYSNWSMKDGVVHVQPPDAVLERMVTIRLHLDDADETNGALIVSPGSHRDGRMGAAQAAERATQVGTHLCAVKAGDALLMKPLILHASRKATSPRPRRVIHLEYANIELPRPLQWREADISRSNLLID